MSNGERTGWRDLALSERHRLWGFNCPSVDLDFLLVEYNLGKPVAIIEYKEDRARMPNTLHPTYRAITELANMADLPFLIAFYSNVDWWFRIYPVNADAARYYREGQVMTEREFVESLYHLRGLCIEQNVLAHLKRIKPISSIRTGGRV